LSGRGKKVVYRTVERGKAKRTFLDRYIICPAALPGGGGVHDHPVAIPVALGKQKWPFIRCYCGTRVFLGMAWEEEMGYTLEQVKQLPNCLVLDPA